MTSSLRSLYRQLARDIYDNRPDLGLRKLAFFSALKGVNYSGGLMVVGRAVNEWKINFQPFELEDPLQMINQLQEVADDSSQCPMMWVSDREGAKKEYNTRKSAFWRTIKQVSGKLGIADISDRSWPGSIVWSNLYKVAPREGGNPSARLIRFQKGTCKQIFFRELLAYRPERLLFLTGLNNWALDFVNSNPLRFEPIRRGSKFTTRGLLSLDRKKPSIETVIAPHPQGKSENSIVQSIVSSFRKMEA